MERYQMKEWIAGAKAGAVIAHRYGEGGHTRESFGAHGNRYIRSKATDRSYADGADCVAEAVLATLLRVGKLVGRAHDERVVTGPVPESLGGVPEGAEGGRWDVLSETTPSGKTLFKCRVCGRKSSSPDNVCPRGCENTPPEAVPDPFEYVKQLERKLDSTAVGLKYVERRLRRAEEKDDR